MPATTVAHRAGRSSSVKRNDERIGRAAERAAWAGLALEAAARELDGASGVDGNALSGLAELVQDQATRAASLAEEIEHRRFIPTEMVARESSPATASTRRR